MSSITADLEDAGGSLPSLPRIRAPPPPSSTTAAANSSSNSAERAGGDEGCRTPTSSEHRIPPPLTCPPAPRKPSRKRRAPPSEVDELLRKVSDEEIEAFFRSCELKPASCGVFRVAAKRTCSCK